MRIRQLTDKEAAVVMMAGHALVDWLCKALFKRLALAEHKSQAKASIDYINSRYATIPGYRDGGWLEAGTMEPRAPGTPSFVETFNRTPQQIADAIEEAFDRGDL